MDEIFLDLFRRDVIGKQVKALRREGKIPAILYGPDMVSIPVIMDTRVAERTLSGVTSSSLVRVALDGNEYHTLVRDRQRDVITGQLIHVDFQVVSLTEMVRAEVAIQLDGESPAVSDQDGVLVVGLDTISVESLPQDLPSRILVDISVLEEIGDSISVRDIAFSPGLSILSEPDEVVVSVTGRDLEELPEEEEEEELEELEEPEIIRRGKREEDEGEDDEG